MVQISGRPSQMQSVTVYCLNLRMLNKCVYCIFQKTWEDSIAPDKEIQEILLSYPEGKLGEYAETAVQKLRTSIYDELPYDRSNLSIHLYLLRNKHDIGNGSSVISSCLYY